MKVVKLRVKVRSSRDKRVKYTVVRHGRKWLCSCIGWTRRYPRRDCRHIKFVKGKQR